jgi:hypothetical protein
LLIQIYDILLSILVANGNLQNTQCLAGDRDSFIDIKLIFIYKRENGLPPLSLIFRACRHVHHTSESAGNEKMPITIRGILFT